MKKIKEIILDLENLWRIATGILIFFYLSQLIWPYLELPYSNLFESHGSMAQLEINPLNNSLRYLVTLCLTLLFPAIVSFFSKKHQKIILRVVFITLLGLSFFLIALVPKVNIPVIDLLHDGEKLGEANLFLGGRKLYSDLFFFHGAFDDPLLAVSSFFLFGRSIGSYYLLTGGLLFLSLMLFFTLLGMVIKSDLVFYLSSLWFFNLLSGSNNLATVNFSVSHTRDLFVWIVLILLWLILKKTIKTEKALFVIGFLSGLQYFIAFDRAYFLTFLALLLFFVFSFFSTSPQIDKYFLISSRERLKENFKKGKLVIFGFLFGFFLQLPLVGLKSFLAFLKIAFWQLPRIVGSLHEQEFILISQHQNLAQGLAFWTPIFLIIFNGSFLLHQFFLPFFKNKKRGVLIFNSKSLYLIIVFFFSIIFFRAALVRLGAYHLNYGSTIIFLVTFLILDLFLLKLKESFRVRNYYRQFKYLLGFALLGWVLFAYNLPQNYQMKTFVRKSSQCVFYPQLQDFTSFYAYFGELVFCPPYQKPEDITSFFALPKKPDTYWLSEPTTKAVEFLNANSSKDDYIFVFTNEALFYYLLKAKSPTRFADIWAADISFFKKEALDDLKRNLPKYVIYTTGGSAEIQDGLSSASRFSEINQWIIENYPQKINFGPITILAK